MKSLCWAALLVACVVSGCGKKDEGPTRVKAGDRMISVKVVSTKGCVSTPKTIRLIRVTAEEIGAKIDLSQVIISTMEEANTYKFHGSPTVLVDGQDLDPAMRDNHQYGFT